MPSRIAPSPPTMRTNAPTGGARGTSRGSSPVSSELSLSLLWALCTSGATSTPAPPAPTHS
eukprot:7985290-Lingulodinium_polyedra.AAC.1